MSSNPRLDASGFELAAANRVAALDVDLDSFAATFGLIRAATRATQYLESEVHRPAGWSYAGFRVMFTVWVAGELEPRDIARLSGLSRAAVSSVLNTLERDGLAERTRESSDRRLVTVRLTASGTERLEQAYRAQNQREQQLLAELAPSERRELASLLRKILQAPLDHN